MPSDLPAPDPAVHMTGGEDGGQRGRKQRELLEHFGLVARSSVLEIGCGIGRLAYELADLLDVDGRYAGFDISPVAIAWLNEHYAPRLPSFRFDYLDIANPRFHPDGQRAADAVRFPYPDADFDIVCAYEVFMHMEQDGVVNYLDEVARVLRPAGRAILTFMAIFDDTTPARHAGRDFVALADRTGVYTRFPDRDGWSLGYDDRLIRRMLGDAGLEVESTIEGNWHFPWEERDTQLQHGCDVYVVSLKG